MATANERLIQRIRNASRKLTKSDQYQWGHMGSCNCGFLAQEITKLDKAEIHRRAMQGSGDWNEQLNDYCPTSGLPMDDLIKELLDSGLAVEDLQHLERLSDPRVTATITLEGRELKHNINKDVVEYMNAWAELLEKELIKDVNLPDFVFQPQKTKTLENSEN